MMYFQLLLLLWFLFYISLAYPLHLASSYIKEFNDSAIQLTLEKTTYSLIYFYSDSCQYCQLFNPVFENLCALYNTNGTEEATEFQILKTNARVNNKLSMLFGIRHYPTLKLLHYPSKEILDYEEGRDLHSLIDYIESKTLLKPKYENFQSEVKNIYDPKELLQGDRDKVVIFIMSYMAEWKDYHYPAHDIQRIAYSHQDIDFYVYHGDDLEHSELLPQFGISNFPSLVYIREGKFKSFNTDSAYQSNVNFDGSKIENFIDSIDLDKSWWRPIEPVKEVPITNDSHFDEGYEESDDDIDHIEL